MLGCGVTEVLTATAAGTVSVDAVPVGCPPLADVVVGAAEPGANGVAGDLVLTAVPAGVGSAACVSETLLSPATTKELLQETVRRGRAASLIERKTG